MFQIIQYWCSATSVQVRLHSFSWVQQLESLEEMSTFVFNQSFSKAHLVELWFTQGKTVVQLFKKLSMHMYILKA